MGVALGCLDIPLSVCGEPVWGVLWQQLGTWAAHGDQKSLPRCGGAVGKSPQRSGALPAWREHLSWAGACPPWALLPRQGG